MSDRIFEPFGEAVPVARRKPDQTGTHPVSGNSRLYKAALFSFWLIVAVIVVARVTFHGNIFAFNG